MFTPKLHSIKYQLKYTTSKYLRTYDRFVQTHFGHNVIPSLGDDVYSFFPRADQVGCPEMNQRAPSLTIVPLPRPV